MDEFDYLNGTLSEWLDLLEGVVGTHEDTLYYIEHEYLPRFEAALHRNAVKSLSGNIV